MPILGENVLIDNDAVTSNFLDCLITKIIFPLWEAILIFLKTEEPLIYCRFRSSSKVLNKHNFQTCMNKCSCVHCFAPVLGPKCYTSHLGNVCACVFGVCGGVWGVWVGVTGTRSQMSRTGGCYLWTVTDTELKFYTHDPDSHATPNEVPPQKRSYIILLYIIADFLQLSLGGSVLRLTLITIVYRVLHHNDNKEIVGTCLSRMSSLVKGISCIRSLYVTPSDLSISTVARPWRSDVLTTSPVNGTMSSPFT